MDYKVLPIPPPPDTQALTSKSFKPPPLDGSLTIPEIYDWHLENTPSHPLFVYSDGNGDAHTILWPKAVRAVHRAGRHAQTLFSANGAQSQVASKVIAILAVADTITCFTFLMGIVRAGHVAFPISPRNSPAAIAHLIAKTNVSHILVGAEGSSQSLAESSLELINGTKPTTSPLPLFEDIYPAHEEEAFIPLPFRRPDLDQPTLILHSSGSTAFPKPITWTHYSLLQLATTPFFGERDLTGVRLSCHSMPMFHGMGAMQTSWTAASGLVITSFQPRSPSILPTPDAVMKGSIDTKSDLIFSVPSFVEAWSRVPEYVSHLQKVLGVLYGGGPMNKAVGDELFEKGVSIFNLYGCTECGIFSPIVPIKGDKDWDYIRIATNARTRLISDGSGSAEFVVLPSPHMLPRVFNTVVDGVDAYATGDLLAPHPTKPGLWKVFGRADDQIMHSTGEKTNPGPLENILNQDPLVQSAVMFGRGRFYAGIIVDPKVDSRFDPSDVEALVKFRQDIWPSVEKLNALAPQHSRLFKEMILVSKPSKPFTYTAKMTARRQAIINDYEAEINELYDNINDTMQPELSLPPAWDSNHTIESVRKTVHNVLKKTIADGNDIFLCGCDSLQATWIRNTVLNALRKTSPIDTRTLPMNFVYANPTIVQLAEYITGLVNSTPSGTAADIVKNKVDEMHTMLAKYTKDFQTHSPSLPENPPFKSQVIVLTGTTGGLGAVLLAKLLEHPNVSRVFAINRKGAGELLGRQRKAFKERGLDEDLLSLDKLDITEGNLVEEFLGLEKGIYDEIQSSATHIIHNAYTVNFNLSLASFESNVAGLHNIINLALSSPFPSPPQLLFTSSVSVLRSYEGKSPVEETLVDASSAVGSGYGESKWVCEQMLSMVSSTTPLRTSIVRLGQLSGMSTNGFWNTQDWVPALFKSSAFVRCFPTIDNDVSWIPIDVAAQAVVEMLDDSRTPQTRVYHVAHPRPVHWSVIAESSAQILRCQLVSYADWLSKVNGAATTNGSAKEGSQAAETAVALAEKNPVLLLSEFFNASNTNGTGLVNSPDFRPTGTADTNASDTEAMGIKRLCLVNSLAISLTLKENCAPLHGGDVTRWVNHWEINV